jgi:diphosphomevalonate decarboxylase
MQKKDIIKDILANTNHGSYFGGEGIAWASSNVALCKYWGKRDSELNLPIASSLSISHGNKGSFTKINHNHEANTDKYYLNGMTVKTDTKFATRLAEFLNLFRPKNVHYLVEIDTNVPIAAGFASSACGFASLVLALDKLYDWQLPKKDLSILARLGSGSACRSIFDGFVEWQMGDDSSGMDSHGIKLKYSWPDLRLGLVKVSSDEKPISSREAMSISAQTSPLYKSWPEKCERDLIKIKSALDNKDFGLLGETAENNAVYMHKVMAESNPSVVYSIPQTVDAITKVYELRLCGVPVYFTQDAGPNIQLLFLNEDEKKVKHLFSGAEIISPFSNQNFPEVIWVNEKDTPIGVGEKLSTHIDGKLHRAFSVVIMRERNKNLEILLQRRSSNKYHSANLWSNTCCGHPKPGEDLVKAAEKRLFEEMGFRAALTPIGKFHYKTKFSEVNLSENEIDHVLVGYADLENIPFNKDEVQDVRWVPISRLLTALEKQPKVFTVWLKEVLNLFG